MDTLKFNKELYSKIALIKAAYNFTDSTYVHIDADDKYYYVELKAKEGCKQITENDFSNEMLAQSVRHEVYQQTKNIRELLYARSVASSTIVDEALIDEPEETSTYNEDEILKDWFAENEIAKN